MQIANCKLRYGSMRRHRRRAGVYIAVLATSLIVALLGLTALMVQRIQNRTLTASADIRQAQLNANTAVELALLTINQDANWRATQPHGRWFTGRSTEMGACSLDVIDPADANLANNPDDPFVVRGIGSSGQAEQRVEITLDPRKQPLGCLRSAVAAADEIYLQNDMLRTNGLITATQISATTSQVYGSVEAVSIGGATYYGTTTQIEATKQPTMPDWSTVFDYYRTNGTQLSIASLPSSTPNLAVNPGFESDLTGWTGEPPGIPKADLDIKDSPVVSGTKSVKVKGRSTWYSGAAQRIDAFVKPGQQYTIEIWVRLDQGVTELFCLSIYTKGTGGSVQFNVGPSHVALRDVWLRVTATLTAPPWSGSLEYAFVKIAGANSLNDRDFIIDDFVIKETTTGRFIYRKVLSPSVNNLYSGAPTNPQGLYWIDCNGNPLIIERSRILGTLLVVNPGSNSRVADGPICWSPAVPGYPALLVDADDGSDAEFLIHATNRALSEMENGVNYNLTGAAHEQFGEDADTNDIYQSEIRGLIAIRGNLKYANRPLIRGQIVVGNQIRESSGELDVEYHPDSLLNPPPGFWGLYSYLRRPASARKVVLP